MFFYLKDFEKSGLKQNVKFVRIYLEKAEQFMKD